MASNPKIKYPQSFSKSITINSRASEVWEALTNTDLMMKWMAEEEINIFTDWSPGSSIVIRGNVHWVPFENKGTVLRYESWKTLQYSHLSSLSKLSDEPKNYSLVEFALTPLEEQTNLVLTLANFPTESIYKHLVFYWSNTLGILKKFVEER